MHYWRTTGASDGDTLALGVPNALMTWGGGTLAWVSAANTITIRACNIDPSSPQKTAGTGAIRVDVYIDCRAGSPRLIARAEEIPIM